MNRIITRITCFVILTLVGSATLAHAQDTAPAGAEAALSTTFTYQGQLKGASGGVSDGIHNTAASRTYTCVGAYDENYAALDNTCH